MRNLAFYLAFGGMAFVYGLAFDRETPVEDARPALAGLAVKTTALETGRAGLQYAGTIAASGGVKPYPFTAGNLHAGLSAQPLVPIDAGVYAGQSDIALAPFPITAPIEGQPPDCAAGGWPHTTMGDAHVLVVDRNTCFLYETFNTHRCNGQWASDSQTIWDLKDFQHRPYGDQGQQPARNLPTSRRLPSSLSPLVPQSLSPLVPQSLSPLVPQSLSPSVP
jgi:hypothetical protein